MEKLKGATDIVLKSVTSMGESFLAQLPNVVLAIVVLIVFWGINRLLGKFLDSFLDKLRLRLSLSELLKKITNISIWVFASLVAATIIFPSFTPSKILTIVGLSSIAIGFAFKDIFENFLAGILILFREPFEIGDFIECEGLEGTVEDITIRDTNIRRVDGQRIVVPNAMLFKNPIYVRTDKDIRRITIMCGIAYGEDIGRVRDVIRKAVKDVDIVKKSQEVQIFADSFGSSSIDFEVTWWTGSSQLEIRASKDKVVEAVKKALDHAGIEIPFPYRTLTFKEPIKVNDNTQS
ncbi:MAG: mechanosensitive ion channel family protein [Candidatus Dadabacteria bacterium]|nr:mechanosensitive ion channel family protein [Candidatus Dadabacteria bacterium]NIS07689.1 mechanosensitive ion channel family protein [Candidatus Dadabacteria bacterium]NIV42268.1 mechanosensitive ion channel [Candidatus Dadabacteria bacterium]NIX14775.1 mechanosensitive ion channel [Candidatus Dadabacteria bacterium]NIY21316.1 mechanosensitive ion channel [Candidatus Dadabacteria bacterium]